MQKLAALDASFLYNETSRSNSNIGNLQVLEMPAGVTTAEFISTLKSFIASRIHNVPYMTRKLVFVPGSLDHPVWVEDPNIDMDYHIIELPVCAPGGLAEMEAAVAQVHEKKMPLDRPLWAIYVLTGLRDGNIAYYNQIHHATIDGASGNAALDFLMDESPDHPPVAGPIARDTAEPALERRPALTLVEDAFSNFLRYQMETSKRVLGTMDASRRLFQRAIDPTQNFGAYRKRAPETPFSGEVSAKRTWKIFELPLADVKQIGKTVDATVNDVFMEICAGGLRRYLERKGELPGDSLIAGCPVSLRQPGDTSNRNQVTMMLVELATDVADPIERLKAIRSSSQTAKGLTADIAAAIDTDTALPGLPAIMQTHFAAQEALGLTRFVRAPMNVVISNVPGPRTTRYSNGAKMLTHYPISIATHGAALNITTQSYLNRMYVGITACAKAIPDADLLREDMLAAFAELKFRLLPTNVSELRPRQLSVTVEDMIDQVMPAADPESSAETEEKVA